MARVAKKALEEVKKVVKLNNLGDCRLEIYKYPRNCAAVVVAEFCGGHRAKKGLPYRTLTFDEWTYILGHSSQVYPTGDGSRIGSGATTIHFSERKDQSIHKFSGKKLFECLTENGFEGNMIEDPGQFGNGYRFYQVKLTPEYITKLGTPSVHLRPPAGSKPIVPVGQW